MGVGLYIIKHVAHMDLMKQNFMDLRQQVSHRTQDISIILG